MQKLRSVQVLRGVAAMGVVIYHSTGARFGVGAAGVDLFFVISGFIMAHVSVGRAPLDFMADRLWRILPLWFVALAAQLLLFPAEWNQCRALASVTMWPAWPYWCFPYVVQGWTLSYELLFYLLVALFIRRQGWLFVVLPALVAWRLISPTPPFLWLGNPLVLEFLMGVALAKLPRRYGPHLLFIGLVWIALAPVEPKSLMRVVYWGIPAAMIVHGFLAVEKAFKERQYRVPVALGDASYSIYLFHVMLMRPLIGQPAVLSVMTAMIGGYIIHRLIERTLLSPKRFLPVRPPNLETGAVRVDSI